MAHPRRTAEDNTDVDIIQVGEDQASLAGLADASQWLPASVANSQQSMAWIVQLQQLLLKPSLSWTDYLTTDLREMQEAKDLLHLSTAQWRAINRQFDIWATQITAAMQQVIDSQLLWLGQLDKKVDAAEAVNSPNRPDRLALVAWGKAQDEWLQLTRNWINSIRLFNAAGKNPFQAL